MDHCHLPANYSFDHYNEFKYDSGKNQLHTESGYESLLATSANSNSFFQNSNINDSSNDSLFSLPTTPVKSASKFIYNGNNCSTTPDFKQQYVADINSFYFKSIRSSYDSSSNDNYPSSQSQSPKVSSFNANVESYMHTRDHMSSKLLRSPAFKIENNYSPQQPSYQPIERPSIKSFSSRFVDAMPTFEKFPAPAAPPKPTPTEAEFMQMLINNHHIPDNPEFLIGRGMGIDNVNILGELNKRSMSNVTEKIFSYMNVGDIVRVGCVSKEWRNIVKSSKINKERVRFIKNKRHIYETTKENHIKQGVFQESSNKRKINQLMASDKRDMFKSSKTLNSDNVSTGGVFSSLDVNRLNNTSQVYRNQCKRVLESQFRDFSISDEAVFSLSPTKRSSIKRSPIKRQSPVKRLSPMKRQSPIKSANITTPLICSKKSKKNLKRL